MKHLFINDVCNFFADLDNSQILIEVFFKHVCCLQCHSGRHNTILRLICIANIVPNTFLTLENQNNNTLSSDLLCCLFPWYKYSPHGWFPAANLMSVDTEFGKKCTVVNHEIVFLPYRCK